MKRRALTILLSLVLLVSLASCSTDDDAGETDASKAEAESVEQEAEETESEDIDEESDSSEEIYFKDNEVKIEDLKINIKETKVIPVGEVGNEYGEKPVLAIWYDVTNLSDKDINPTTAWFAVFDVIQDNNPDAINELGVGMLPDDKHLDSQTETIKENGTVENSIAYELDDLETPVELIASQGIMGDEIGRKEIDIK